jgi:hypothetical protein
MKDTDGNNVKVGDIVEVLSINERGLEFLEPEYVKEIRGAVGQNLEIDFIDEHDRVWVDIISASEDETRCGQTLFLRSNQIRKA